MALAHRILMDSAPGGELSVGFQVAPRAPFHKAAIWSELTKLYTSAAEPYIGTEYADQKSKPRVTIEQPCACLWGVTVPGPFWTALEGGALGDGSMARFMVFLTDDDYPVFGINFGGLGLTTEEYGPPRTYGLDITYEY
jgi:hypothetical protein